MDILIKSFNRPYYLHRCIHSIYENVLDFHFVIKILDDGTPAKYLHKIQAEFPEVIILKSSFYDEKSTSIENNQKLNKSEIPIDSWLDAAKNASEYFVLLEDDIWLTEKINLEETHKKLKEENICFLKLFWLANPLLIHGTTIKEIKGISVFKPDVFVKNSLLYKMIFGISRFRKLMKFLNLYSDKRYLNYYAIYSVAGVVFHKEYFLALWNNHQNVVDENLQMQNAIRFWSKNPSVQFARMNQEAARTGFLSSATNKNYDSGNFDVFEFNKILNEAWFKDDFDILKDIPSDLNQEMIVKLLQNVNNPKAQVADWLKWVSCFKSQFRSFGCKI